tara:strand:+ start:248 stop:1261 length:1014 start_codon:yes stop_codon:yes gene_type:complete
MIVFAVETSCDETSVCILNSKKDILSHIVFTQENHEKYGGVIPELASRAHLQILQKISKEAISESNISLNQIDVFCATCGPGLVGGLLVGSIFTKSLALGLKKPFVPINHLEGHILSPTFNNSLQFPHICFLLTGGHTQIYLVNKFNNFELLGETLDDAIGEAFDKVAKLLKLSYPGGPEIERNAKKGKLNSYDLPHPLESKKNLNFSFSGIKTAVNLIVKKNLDYDNKFIQDLSATFQNKVAEILKSKIIIINKYLNEKKIIIKDITMVGGVARNKYIYLELSNEAKKFGYSVKLPEKQMLSDNAAMIGWACIQKSKKNIKSDYNFKVNPRLTVYN